MAVGDTESLSQDSTTPDVNGHMTNSVAETSSGSEKPEADTTHDTQSKTTRLTKLGSFSHSHSKKDANKSQLIKGSESHLPPSRSMSASHMSHMKKQREISKEPVLNEDTPGESTANEESEREGSRPPSRLKFPGSSGRTTPSRLLSGRVTPSNMSKSGLQRPSGHAGKMSEKNGSTMSLNEEGVVGGVCECGCMNVCIICCTCVVKTCVCDNLPYSGKIGDSEVNHQIKNSQLFICI